MNTNNSNTNTNGNQSAAAAASSTSTISNTSDIHIPIPIISVLPPSHHHHMNDNDTTYNDTDYDNDTIHNGDNNNDDDDSSIFHIRTLTLHERFVYLAKKIQSSPYILPAYIILALLNVCVMVYQIVYGLSHWIVITIEFILNFFLLFEVSVNLIAMRSEFFKHTTNIIDLTLTMLCMLLFCIELRDNEQKSNSSNRNSNELAANDIIGELDAVLLAVRYLFQLSRLGALVQRSRSTVERIAIPDINFMKNHKQLRAIDEHFNQLEAKSSQHNMHAFHKYSPYPHDSTDDEHHQYEHVELLSRAPMYSQSVYNDQHHNNNTTASQQSAGSVPFHSCAMNSNNPYT